jgi:hypothetical protein
MDVAVETEGDVGQSAENGNGEVREVALAVLGDVAVKAQALSGRASEKAQQIARENRRKARRKYRRATKKQTRRLERRLEKAARRLQIDTPLDKRRRRRTGRRTGLLLIVIGGGVAVFMAWKARQAQTQEGAAEAGPVPDAFGAGVERAGDGERAPSGTTTS